LFLSNLKSYLSTLGVGATDLTFDFSAGASETLVVTVENTGILKGALCSFPAPEWLRRYRV
jgi:hypothetical protein